jgi:3-hydroxybutyrate dehydrogenase
MKGKVALVTGSTSGIGLGIAKALASQGCNIVLNGFGKIEDINKIIQEIESEFSVQTFHQPADLTKPEEIKNLISETITKFGKLDVLVNNAGVQHVCPIDEFPDDKWELIMRLDLISCFYTIKYALPSMKKHGFGRIINIASAHALVASPFKSAYVAAKHGVLGLSKTVALEVAKQGITCNAVCPGYVKTPLVLGQIADTAKSRGISEEEVINNVMLGPQATKRFVEISEVADLVVFLCTDSASSITGTGISIDGGWTSQ